MDYKCRINEIERCAAALGVAVRDLCAAAGISPSTYWRWQKPDANPRLRDMEKAFAAMEGYLTARELETLDSLSRKHPEAAAELARVALEEGSHV